MAGPFKFSYKDLQKQVRFFLEAAFPAMSRYSSTYSPHPTHQGVIVDSEVPALSRKKTQFLISSAEVGIFDIVAKIAGISVEKVPTAFFNGR